MKNNYKSQIVGYIINKITHEKTTYTMAKERDIYTYVGAILYVGKWIVKVLNTFEQYHVQLGMRNNQPMIK